MNEITPVFPIKTMAPPLSVSYGANPRDAAIDQLKSNGQLLNKLGKIGGKNRRKRGGVAAGLLEVPIVKPLYRDPSAGGQDAVGTTTALAANTNQNNANAVYDSQVAKPIPIPAGQLKSTQNGGTHIMNSNTTWGCFSGGKKSKKKGRKTKGRKSRKMKKLNKRKTKKRKGN